MSVFAIILITLLVTALVIAIGANIATTEKRLLTVGGCTQRRRRLRRALGILLGPRWCPATASTSLAAGQITRRCQCDSHGARNITFETFVFATAWARFPRTRLRAPRRAIASALDWLGSRTEPESVAGRARRGCEPRHRRRLVSPRPHQQSDVSQAAEITTANWFHRRCQRAWVEDGLGLPPARDHFKAEDRWSRRCRRCSWTSWIKATGRVLHGADYFPRLAACGDMDAQMFGSSPVGGSESMHLMVLLALTAARTSIDIENAYFVPDKLTVESLCSAAQRGVRVRIVVPGWYTERAPRPLGRAGTALCVAARGRHPIHEISADDDACQVLVIDGLGSSVGLPISTTARFRLNDKPTSTCSARNWRASRYA